MVKTIILINQKGGVGKSTSSFSLAHGISDRGHHVLLIDLDPQASLSILAGFHNPDSIHHSISNLLLDSLQDEPDRRIDIVKHIGQNLDSI